MQGRHCPALWCSGPDADFKKLVAVFTNENCIMVEVIDRPEPTWSKRLRWMRLYPEERCRRAHHRAAGDLQEFRLDDVTPMCIAGDYRRQYEHRPACGQTIEALPWVDAGWVLRIRRRRSSLVPDFYVPFRAFIDWPQSAQRERDSQ
jgi:hypothetical protein